MGRQYDQTEGTAGRASASFASGGLGYRPKWSPTLVSTVQELAEQLRLYWGEAAAELADRPDPRVIDFLSGIPGTEAAIRVINSSQASGPKLVQLLGVLDPNGPIQFQGAGLDDASLAHQVEAGRSGDEIALRWLESVQGEQILTAYAEITRSQSAARADFWLARWDEQASTLIDATTINANTAEFDFSMIRSLLRSRAENQRRANELVEIMRSESNGLEEGDPKLANLRQRIDKISDIMEAPASLSGDRDHSQYGSLEDWFFEETRSFLHERVRRSLPELFACALAPAEDMLSVSNRLVADVRRLATEASAIHAEYSLDSSSQRASSGSRQVWLLSAGRQRVNYERERITRIIQAVSAAKEAVDQANDSDLGTIVAARAVLVYARDKHDDVAVYRRAAVADREGRAAVQRDQEARVRAEEAQRRLELALDSSQADHSRDVGHPAARRKLSASQREQAAKGRSNAAERRGQAAAARLAAAKSRERWAVTEEEATTDHEARPQWRREQDAARQEQAEADAERLEAVEEQKAADAELARIPQLRAEEAEQKAVADETMRRHMEVQNQETAEKRRKYTAARESEEEDHRRREEERKRKDEEARVIQQSIRSRLSDLLSTPPSRSIWDRRRRKVDEQRNLIEGGILSLQAGIGDSSLLVRGDQYLGEVKKVTDYGAFISLPAGKDGLLRGPSFADAVTIGQRIPVAIDNMPYGKSIILKRLDSDR